MICIVIMCIIIISTPRLMCCTCVHTPCPDSPLSLPTRTLPQSCVRCAWTSRNAWRSTAGTSCVASVLSCTLSRGADLKLARTSEHRGRVHCARFAGPRSSPACGCMDEWLFINAGKGRYYLRVWRCPAQPATTGQWRRRMR